MMKEILTPLHSLGLLFKRFEPFSLKNIGSRKRLEIYHGVDTQNRYTLVMRIQRKSRVLQKDVREWLEMKQKIEGYLGYPILQNVAIIEAPLCSKAKALLESEEWRVITA